MVRWALVVCCFWAAPAHAQVRVVPRLGLSGSISTAGISPAAQLLPTASGLAPALQSPSISALPAALPPAVAPTVAPVSAPAAVEAAVADPKTKPYELPRAYSAYLAAPKDDASTLRYLEMIAKLRSSWGSPFDNATLNSAQIAAAGAAGLAVTPPADPKNAISIQGGNGSWFNRWAGGLKRNMGVTVLWSPLGNHNTGSAASYNPRGWLWADNYGPLMTKPSSELFHEFLHAFVARGKHSAKFAPLRTTFSRSSWEEFPNSKLHKNAGYANGHSFQSDEILTNLHTVFHRAKVAAEVYGMTPDDWRGSAFSQAPREVQRIIQGIDTPLFLSESVGEMSAALLPGATRVSRRGLEGIRFTKNYGPENGSIPYVGEVEKNVKNDHGFYEAVLGEGKNERLTVRFFTRGQFKDAAADQQTSFPVLIGNGRFSVRVELDLAYVLEHDLENPAFQEAIAASAARLAVPRLSHLATVNERLGSHRKRLKELQARGETHVDLALLREISAAAKGAFSMVARYFIRQPSPQPSTP